MSGAIRRLINLDEVGSTNTAALEAARSGDPGTLWVTAARQIAGRGRRGRAWISERGNLYASLLLIDSVPLDQVGNLPLVVSLGVRNGLACLLAQDSERVQVKWPNDVLIGGGKAVGILLESERLADGRQAIVVGCGVNVAHVPLDAPYKVTSLVREGATADLDVVFDKVAAGVEQALEIFDRGRGFMRLRQQWLEKAVGIGEACRINLPHETLFGKFEGLDDTGRLVLRTESGVKVISAGDLFFFEHCMNGNTQEAEPR